MTASDGELSDTKSVTVNVTDVEENQYPTITSSDSSTVLENASTDTVIYDAEANDPDNDTLTYSVSGSDASYVTIDSDDGEVRLIQSADHETKDSYTFDVTASDGELSDTKSVTVNVTDVEEDEGPLQIDLIGSGYDPIRDQNFIELQANGDFGGNSNIMLGFHNPLVTSLPNSSSFSSILGSSTMSENYRTDKFYFNKHINNIEVKSAFLDSNTISSDQFDQIINFGRIELEVPNADLDYGTVSTSFETLYEYQKPIGININVYSQDDLSGIWISSVYFTGKNDQGDFDFSIFEDYRHNYTFTYFDEIINNSVETIELNFSELPNITSTSTIAIRDNAGNFFSSYRDNNFLEIIKLDNLINDNFSSTTEQPLILVSENSIYSGSISGSEFDDYLVLEGNYEEYNFNIEDNNLVVGKDENIITTNSIEKLIFANGEHQVIDIIRSIDTEAPVLNSISIRDDTLSPGDTLYIDYNASDESGIGLFGAGFKDENGNNYDAFDFNDDGVAELSVNSDMLSGNYEISTILLRDDASDNNPNQVIYGKNGDLSGDVSDAVHNFDFSALNFSVTNPNEVDTEGPVLNSISLRDGILSPGDTLYIDYDVSDESGIKSLLIRYQDENGNFLDVNDFDNDGVAELTINSDMSHGNYNIYYLELLDETSLGNYSAYHNNGSLSGDVFDAVHNFNLSALDFEIGEKITNPNSPIDIDPSSNLIYQNAIPGTPVGITASVPESSNGDFTYSILTENDWKIEAYGRRLYANR